jgi:hypothetical protein
MASGHPIRHVAFVFGPPISFWLPHGLQFHLFAKQISNVECCINSSVLSLYFYRFCADRENVLHSYQTVPGGEYWPVPEYAAVLSGPLGSGIVRARINDTGG